MTLIFVSLIAAATQMGLLLLTARLLGAEAYSSFSLIITSAVFFAACCSEWLRMILARQGGSLRHRMRDALLGSLRVWVLRIALTLLVAMVPAAAVAEAISGRLLAVVVVAISVVAAGSMLSDMAATFLRFTYTRQAYNCFVLIRVALMGGASVAAAQAGTDGPGTAIAFGSAGVACGGGFIVFLWPRRFARKGLVLRLAPVGWSLASGSLGTNISLMLSRFVLGMTLPATISGGVFLAIDLATRGANVMGVSINTWGNRLIINAAHRFGPAGAKREFKSVSAVFITLWFSLVAFGMLASAAIPLVTLPISVSPLYFAATVPTLLAIFSLFLRTFLLDAYLSAIEHHREVALAGASTVLLAVFGVLLTALIPTPVMAIVALPAAVVVSLACYLVRNRVVFFEAVDRPSAMFGIAKTSAYAITGGLIIIYTSWLTVIVTPFLAAVAALDTWWLWRSYRRLRAPKRHHTC